MCCCLLLYYQKATRDFFIFLFFSIRIQPSSSLCQSAASGPPPIDDDNPPNPHVQLLFCTNHKNGERNKNRELFLFKNVLPFCIYTKQKIEKVWKASAYVSISFYWKTRSENLRKIKNDESESIISPQFFIYRPSDHHHTQKDLVYICTQQYGESIYTFLLQDRIIMQHTVQSSRGGKRRLNPREL